MNPVVECPKCKYKFSADEAMSHQIEEKIRKEYQDDNEKRREEDRKKMLAWQEDQKRKLFADNEVQVKSLKEENERKEKQLEESRSQELKLRQEKNQLQDERKSWDLDKQRQLDVEREKIRQKTEEEILEKQRLKDKEKDQMIDGLKRSLEDAQRKANQGSQQLQGEILELELEEMLKVEFPFDEIIPVPKGINGADVLQKVHDQNGRECGIIIWESKRTKNWTEDWVPKLKDDMRTSKAEIAILVTTVLPTGVKNFSFKDGIYVTSFECLLPVAALIRLDLIKLFMTKLSSVGKNEKMEVLYSYLSGNEFKQRVEAIVEAFSSMKDDLEQEKRVFTKLWAKREKEIERVVNNTIGMHGDLQGLMGTSLPEIKSLQSETLLLEVELEVSR